MKRQPPLFMLIFITLFTAATNMTTTPPASIHIWRCLQFFFLNKNCMNKFLSLAFVLIIAFNLTCHSTEITKNNGYEIIPLPTPEFKTIDLKEMGVCPALDSLLRNDIIPFMKNLYLVKDYFIEIYFDNDNSIGLIIEKKDELDRFYNIFAFNDDYYYSIYFSGLTTNKCITIKSDNSKKHRYLKPGTYIPDFYDPYVRDYTLINGKYIQTESAMWVETNKSDIDPILYYSVTKLSDNIRKHNSLLYITRPKKLEMLNLKISK